MNDHHPKELYTHFTQAVQKAGGKGVLCSHTTGKQGSTDYALSATFDREDKIQEALDILEGDTLEPEEVFLLEKTPYDKACITATIIVSVKAV